MPIVIDYDKLMDHMISERRKVEALPDGDMCPIMKKMEIATRQLKLEIDFDFADIAEADDDENAASMVRSLKKMRDIISEMAPYSEIVSKRFHALCQEIDESIERYKAFFGSAVVPA